MADYQNVNFEESDVYAALGMDPSQQPEAADPANAGGNEQGVTAPAGAENKESNTQDAVDAGNANAYGDGSRAGRLPALQTAGDANAQGDGSRAGRLPALQTGGDANAQGDGRTDEAEADAAGVNAPAVEADSGGMSRAERAEQARLRRERETQEKITAAVEAARTEERGKAAEQLKVVFARAGMTDRYNGGSPITTMEEFEAWNKREQAERLTRQLKGGQLTPETFEAAIESSPSMQAAKSIVARLEAQEQERQAESRKQQFEAVVAREMAEIGKINPSIHSLDDVLRMPTGQEFARLVQERGMSYLEAYQLANLDDIVQARSMAAAEGSARQRHGKDHLRTVTGVSGAPVDVPREVVAVYRELMPEMTMEQIRADYAKNTK